MRATLSVGDIKDDLGRLGVFTAVRQPEESAMVVVVVMVSGIEKYSDFKTLREILETDIKGVDAVRLRRMGPDAVVMDVDIQENAAGFSNELALKDFKDFSLYVTNATPDIIELNMVKE